MQQKHEILHVAIWTHKKKSTTSTFWYNFLSIHAQYCNPPILPAAWMASLEVAVLHLLQAHGVGIVVASPAMATLGHREHWCEGNDCLENPWKKQRVRLDVTGSTDSMTSTDDVYALMCFYPSDMFSPTLSLSRQFCNLVCPCYPMLPNDFEFSVQEAKGSWRLCESQQPSTTIYFSAECAALKAWDTNDTIWL